MRKKAIGVILAAMALLIMLSFPAFGLSETDGQYAVDADGYFAQQAQESGADSLYDALPTETQQMLEELGIQSVDFYAILDTSPRAVLDLLMGMLGGQMTTPLKTMLQLAGILLLLAAAQSIVPPGESLHETLRMVGAALMLVSLIGPLSAIFSASAAAIGIGADFMLLLMPVYTGIIAASGQPTLALSSGTLAFAAAEGLAQLSKTFVAPFCGMFAALGSVSSFVPELEMNSLTKMVRKLAIGATTAAASLYAALLSLKGVLANAADSVGARGIQLILKAAVPVVGAALSEAYTSIAGSLTLLKSAVGVFAIMAVLLINAPVLLQSLLWVAGLKLLAAAAGMLGMESITALLDAIVSAVTLLAVLVLFGVVLLLLSAGVALSVRQMPV
ncbi:MAG: stage III sporulation protein AE [Oscillospiraceae bacterium]|jgi:stage III sporulation protein AE|nr:stage III sporulation protein AE [Oscillospiraceae bacterium]